MIAFSCIFCSVYFICALFKNNITSPCTSSYCNLCITWNLYGNCSGIYTVIRRMVSDIFKFSNCIFSICRYNIAVFIKTKCSQCVLLYVFLCVIVLICRLSHKVNYDIQCIFNWLFRFKFRTAFYCRNILRTYKTSF